MLRARPAIRTFAVRLIGSTIGSSKERLMPKPARETHGVRDRQDAILAGDCAHLFRNRFAFFALVNYESVIIAMSGPRTARHFAEIYKLPLGYVCFL